MTPAHQARLDRAEALLAAAGVDRVAYLLVPDFHGRHPIAGDRPFAAWCRQRRPFAVDWVLHGYHHLEEPAHAERGSLRQRLARRLMTGGEGEFLTLENGALSERLALGRRVVADVVGTAPRAFVAPAWLFNAQLIPALARQGFQYTEDHIRVIDVLRGVGRRCPVVSWATRTTLRRIGSRIVSPGLFALFGREAAIRVAIHPLDMDHRRTVDQIRRLLGAGLSRRRTAGYADLFQR